MNKAEHSVFDQPRSEEDHKDFVEAGFTLVELLIVIIILGILAGIVVFAVGNLTDSSQKSACATEAQTFVTAYNAFVAANPGVKPGSGSGTTLRDSVIADLTNVSYNSVAVAHPTEAAKGPFLTKAPNYIGGTPSGFWDRAGSLNTASQTNTNAAAGTVPAWEFDSTSGRVYQADATATKSCQ